MKFAAGACVQRELHFAIVDEVDSILIDEARTPLIISGPSEQNTQIYTIANRLIPSLQVGVAAEPAKGIEESGDFWLDEKAHSATFTDSGMAQGREDVAGRQPLRPADAARLARYAAGVDGPLA